MSYLGELAGLATALCWAFTSICFTEAGRRIGSFKVNKVRLLFAASIYTVVLLSVTGRLFPADLNNQQVFWLVLSGMVGFVFGDGCLFKGLVMIGPRLTMLLHATAPIMAVLIAWVFLGEKLGLLSLVGIALTVFGVTWVITERGNSNKNNSSLAAGHPDSGTLLKGVLLGLGAALGQAAGLVMSKQAMVHSGGSVPPMEASYIRILAALVTIWVISAFRGQLPATIGSMKNGQAMAFALGGAFTGPFLGVWMSLVAVKLIATGIAATLNAMTPVMIIPLLIIIYKEKISLRAVLGAVI
ncbi:MAG: DMT family transporter, partial [candidate division Zixibacteria bacterium]|nr:DMT family transporter [candidate division Zixibacteria bacterium]